jgi:crotonobetainyl-CoA:carnitine CoA-transferase CaiB-like acyl-CoA transferase
MTGPLTGVKVVEVAAYVFVPMAGAVLADLGADVIKVEPRRGDPMRGTTNANTAAQTLDGRRDPNLLAEMSNRGKRSIALDLATPDGRAVLYRLVEHADVFTTSYLDTTRRNLGVDIDDIRAVNPRIIYARGNGWGSRGPMHDAPAYDLVSAWAGSGLAATLADGDGEPPSMPIAIFDSQAGCTLAGAIGIALYRREVTGEGMVVESSLLNAGMFAVQSEISAAPLRMDTGRTDRAKPHNALVNWYRTADGRWLYFVIARVGNLLPDLFDVLGRPDLLDDERFATDEGRARNARDFARILDAVFAQRTFEEWCERFARFRGCWGPLLESPELPEHPQVVANGFVNHYETNQGVELGLVAPAMQFDDVPTRPAGPAPEVGQHSELLLLEHGFSWDEIAALQDGGTIGPDHSDARDSVP